MQDLTVFIICSICPKIIVYLSNGKKDRLKWSIMKVDNAAKQLMLELRGGKENAFAQVFRMYYNPLLNYAGRILHDAELANDLVQETFCNLFERRKELTEDLQLRPYLYKTVYNRCLDVIKHRKVESNYANQELLDFYFSKVIETPEAELALLAEDLKGAIQEAIAKLNETEFEGKTISVTVARPRVERSGGNNRRY